MSDIETKNVFMVGGHADHIVILIPLPMTLSKKSALNLAAWLVAVADDDAGMPESKFTKLLERVLDT